MSAMGELSDRFCYIYSCDLDVNIQLKIGTLEGHRDRPSYKSLLNDPMLKYSGEYQDGCSDLYVTCQIHAEGVPLAIPVSTSYKSFTTRWNWNEWLIIPVKYVDLPRNAILALTIWDIYGTNETRAVGGTTINLFSKTGTFKRGMHDLKVWSNVEADGGSPSKTPGKVKDGSDAMANLSKLSKKHRDGHMTKVDWLDRLTFREIELIHDVEKRDSNSMYLMIEFPSVHFDGTPFTIVYFEKGGDEPFVFNTHADLVIVPDQEIGLENLVENKHHILARSLRSGPTDRDIKPDAKIRDLLNKIVGYPPTKQLSSEEQDLIWKFRFYLTNQPQALAKFLKCVTWSIPQEANQAIELMHKWAPMDSHDSLELLSPTFTHPAVRKYAVKRLNQADTEDLLLYILQLVQALKYEDFDEIKSGLDTTPIISRPDSTGEPTIPSPPSNETTPPAQITPQSQPTKERTSSVGSQDSITETLTSARVEEEAQDQMDLTTFLISRACSNSVLANYFYWFLLVECEDHDITKEQKTTEMYITVMKRFSKALNRGGKECRIRRSTLARQQMFMDKLVRLVKIVARESGSRLKKIERLQALLTNTDVTEYNFARFEPLPLPLDPLVRVKGIIADEASLFKSALMPCRLTFKTEDDTDYVAIFKHGDDLRQDQLVLQIICLFDKLLRKENLDLKLTPYKVLATSSKHGFVQYIDSQGVADVLVKFGSIQNFFRKYAPSETGPYGIAADVMDNYVKSCAGYCMVTYLLGVGDRHLDNLLLTQTGKLFHIDFGYILGRDPKPLPPPMKLSREMVEAMGGTTSEHFHDFKKLCYTAFLHLRRSANLIINLFSLMVDANIPDIALEPDKTVKKVQDKFVLNLSDEEAVLYLQNLIDVSVSAMMAALVEQMHKIAQYWRK